MKNWQKALISPSTPLREALETIDSAGCQIALVVDQKGRLVGTLSDGDARRALIKGLSLTSSVADAMHAKPTCARTDDDRASILATMRRLGLHQLPIVDGSGIVVGLETVDDYLAAPTREQWVVIMAGGLGSRLQELTRDTPKPMLKVGSKPILETIVRNYADQGFRHFYFAVNYKAEQIEEHFGNGSSLGITITYLREKQRMGTAGALSLLPERPTQPFIVTNADLLTKENYGHMVDQHIQVDADATMGVREYEMQVPFGVVREKEGHIESIEEKPIQRFTVSAGTYVLSPTMLDLVPSNQFFDMPSLFEAAMKCGMRTRSYRIDGYWLDIGRLPDYERANTEFHEVFR
jgi:dTDP-glucose pyrophosphorylase